MLTPLADGLTASELEGGEVIQGSGQARETPKHAPSYESLPTSMMDKPRERSEKDDRLDQEWNVMYREMETFKAEHGHCNVPQKQG